MRDTADEHEPDTTAPGTAEPAAPAPPAHLAGDPSGAFRHRRVIDAVQAGERVTLTVHGEPIADSIPHATRTRWLSGAALNQQLAHRAADPELRVQLREPAGETLADM